MADSKKEQPKWVQKLNQNKMKYLDADLNIFRTDKKKKRKAQKNKITKGIKQQNNNVNKNLKKRNGSDKKPFKEHGSFALVWITRLFYIILALGFIYIVDFEKFTRIKDGANFCVNKTVSFLPPAVLRQGEVAVEYFRPVAIVTVNKLNILINGTSTFFNTNPLVKDHWTNIREISSICSAHLVDYMRTLYVQTTAYCLDFKNKLF